MQGHRATELSPEERAVVERLLGRALNDNELVRVSAEDANREEAWKRMLEGMREMQEHFVGVPEEELEALIDEAIDYVRHNPE